jgi:eukaryotic-like serine/threonine-protein kinase
MSTLAAVLNQNPKPPREISRSVPDCLEKIITRCLHKDPTRRFQHMDDLKVTLQDFKEESDTQRLGVEGSSSSAKPRLIPLLPWAAFAVMALAITAWFWFGRSEKAPPEGPLTAVPLTSYPGWELSPSFSPDGKQVAFSQRAPDQQNVDIFIKQVGEEEPFQLTDNPAPDLNPAWSPDGQTIAFARQLSPDRVAYMVKSQRGGRERVLAEFTGAARLPFAKNISWKCSWTSNSKGLVVVGMNASQAGSLFLVLLETGEKRALIDPPRDMADTDPAISPDGGRWRLAESIWVFNLISGC